MQKLLHRIRQIKYYFNKYGLMGLTRKIVLVILHPFKFAENEKNK